MTAQTPTYTAAQYLEAARRAEAEGRIDHALQFYRFLAEQHGATSEGAEAREGLFRLRSEFTRPQRPQPAPAEHHQQQQSTMAGPAPVQTQPAYNPLPTQPTFHAPAQTQSYQEAPRSEGRLPRAIARHDPDFAGLDLPPPHDDYFTARIIARLVGILGWLMLLIGIGLSTLMIVGSFFDRRALAIFTAVPLLSWLGPMLLATGAMIGLLSQLVRAQFDTASASKDLAAIERAKAEL